jgi:hypothetical protein
VAGDFLTHRVVEHRITRMNQVPLASRVTKQDVGALNVIVMVLLFNPYR